MAQTSQPQARTPGRTDSGVKRSLLAGGRAGAGAGALAACGLLFAAALGAEEPVRIAASAWVGDAPTRVIDVLGMLAGDGPPIHIDYDDAGNVALERLMSGEAQFALAGNTPLAAALLQRGGERSPDDPVVLASLGLSTPEHFVIAVRERGVHAPQDLSGRRIGLRTGSSSHFGWSRFAEHHGLDQDTITLVDMPIARLREALLGGDVDAVVSWNPWSGPLLEELVDAATVMPTGAIYTVNWLLLTRRAVADTRPELVDRVVRAYLQATALVSTDPDRVRRVHAHALQLSEESMDAMHPGAIWDPAMNWAVVANMEAAFGWLSRQPGYAGARIPAPPDYLDARALQRSAPDKLMLPPYLLRLPGDDADSGR